MSTQQTLAERIDTEFEQATQRVKRFQSTSQQTYDEQERRLNHFNEVCDRLREVWQPRLEAFAERFGQKSEVSSSLTKARRSATLKLHSPLAQVEVTFAAFPNQEVRNLVLDYRLHILPILMTFDGHGQAEFPLDGIDAEKIGKWIDDRIVEAVRAYLELHQNAYYLKGHLVRDPIAEIEFPKYAAAETLEWDGNTYYFIGAKTRDEFAKRNRIPKVGQA